MVSGFHTGDFNPIRTVPMLGTHKALETTRHLSAARDPQGFRFLWRASQLGRSATLRRRPPRRMEGSEAEIPVSMPVCTPADNRNEAERPGSPALRGRSQSLRFELCKLCRAATRVSLAFCHPQAWWPLRAPGSLQSAILSGGLLYAGRHCVPRLQELRPWANALRPTNAAGTPGAGAEGLPRRFPRFRHFHGKAAPGNPSPRDG